MPERETLEEEAVRRDRELSWTGAGARGYDWLVKKAGPPLPAYDNDTHNIELRSAYPYVHHIPMDGPMDGRLEAKKKQEEGAQNMATLTINPNPAPPSTAVRLYGEGYDLKKSLTIKVYRDGDLIAEGGAILIVHYGEGLLDGTYTVGAAGLYEFEVWQGQLRGKKRTEIVAEASVVVG